MIAERTLLKSILLGAPVLGLLAGAVINPTMKPAPEAPWRKAARAAALHVDSYTFADNRPNDLSPQLPWTGWMNPRTTAPLPEDYYRGETIPIRAGDHAVVQPVGYQPDPLPTPEPRIDPEVANIADQAFDTARELRSGLTGEVYRDLADEHDEPSVADGEVEFGG